MKIPFYGRCDTCWAKVNSRYHSFSRQVEQLQYHPMDEFAASAIVVQILYSEQLTQYCGTECAEIGAFVQLEDRGIPLDAVGPGPIAPCSKCGKPMDLRHSHVAYELMDQTEIRQPWLISAEPHGARTIARVCVECDGSLVTYAETQTVDESGDCAETSEQRSIEFLK